MSFLILIALVILILTTLISKNMEHKTSAKDFFLHLGAIVALYTVTISFVNLIFKIVNKAFPEISNYGYGYYWGQGSEISMPVATLIIVFPIFIILSYFVYKTYQQNPEKKEIAIRRWLTYITLFVAGIILAGDLVTVLYKFLDGQDLTGAFLLKALTVLIVSGFVFGFYLQDIRDKVSGKQRKVWAIVVSIVVLIGIILGFSVLGSPATQRLIRYDNQKIMDLQNMQWQVINYWQMNGTIPQNLPYDTPADTQTQKPYEYRGLGNMSFEICAEFNKEDKGLTQDRSIAMYPGKGPSENDNWSHGAGRHCFQRTIDPVMYPKAQIIR